LVYKSAGFLDRAEEALLEGVRLFPGESYFYYEIAKIYKNSGRIEESVEFLEKAVALKKEFEDELLYTKLYLANFYIEKGRTDKAFKIIRKIHSPLPTPFFYYVISKLYYYVGETEKGYSKALQGMRLSPKHMQPFLEIIEEFEGLNEEKLRDIINKTELNPVIGLKLVQLLINENRKDEALKLLEELNEKFPVDSEVKEIYLKILWEIGRKKQVVDEIEKFLKLLKEKKKAFKCENCGFETDTFDWICPKCRNWETLEINCENR